MIMGKPTYLGDKYVTILIIVDVLMWFKCQKDLKKNAHGLTFHIVFYNKN